MLNDITKKLEQSWVFGFQNLRISDTSENDTDLEIYAIDFTGKPDDSISLFLSHLGQSLSRLQSRFIIIGACLDFEETPFAVVEFKEKTNEFRD